tara:strand:- start:102 stop:548 length:447 start_codon:yes stop_codon:yes gene_type:complete
MNFVFLQNVYPTGEKPIDLKFTYSCETAYNFIENYTNESRQKYMLGEIVIDTVYPIVISLFLSFSLFLIYRDIDLAMIPFLITIVDYLENIGIMCMLYYYPIRIDSLAWVISGLTTLKWVLFGLCVGVVVFGAMGMLIKKTIRRYRKK